MSANVTVEVYFFNSLEEDFYTEVKVFVRENERLINQEYLLPECLNSDNNWQN